MTLFKFQELPEMPGDWIDFTSGRYPGLSAPDLPYSREFLHAHLERIQRQVSPLEKPVRELMDAQSLRTAQPVERIRQIRQSGSVAVVVNIEADLFGGALAQFLKCLSAIKVCGYLKAHGIKAVPVCWLHAPGTADPKRIGPVRILDAGSDLHRLRLHSGESSDRSSQTGLPLDRISDLIREIETIGKNGFDPEILEMLKTAYTRDASWSSACSELFSAIMRAWGPVVVDSEASGFRSELYAACTPLTDSVFGYDRSGTGPSDIAAGSDHASPENTGAAAGFLGFFIQGALLPVFAHIVDCHEIAACGEAHAGIKSIGLAAPIAWPAASATLIDARGRKILEKYGLGFRELLKGEQAVLSRLSGNGIRSTAGKKLEAVKMAVEKHVADLNEPAMESKSFRKAKERCRKRVVYQLDKMKNRIASAQREKQEVMQRQIRRVCNYTVPDGIRQENGLAGIALPLRYSLSILSFLYENLDVMTFKHQLVDLE